MCIFKESCSWINNWKLCICILMVVIIRGYDLNEVSNDCFNYIKDKNFWKLIVNYIFDK